MAAVIKRFEPTRIDGKDVLTVRVLFVQDHDGQMRREAGNRSGQAGNGPGFAAVVADVAYPDALDADPAAECQLGLVQVGSRLSSTCSGKKPSALRPDLSCQMQRYMPSSVSLSGAMGRRAMFMAIGRS